MKNRDQHQSCNEIKALFLFFLHPRGFVDAAVSENIRKDYEDGIRNPDPEEDRPRELRRFRALRRKLWQRFLVAIAVVATALLLGWLLGLPKKPIETGEALSLSSIFLVTWAGLFTVGGHPDHSPLSGKTLSERLHPVIYIPIYGSAVVLHTLSVLA